MWCFLTPLDLSQKVYDEFNRYLYTTDELHTVYDCNNCKGFENRDSAFVFYYHAINEEGIDHVSIDSMTEKQFRVFHYQYTEARKQIDSEITEEKIVGYEYNIWYEGKIIGRVPFTPYIDSITTNKP